MKRLITFPPFYFFSAIAMAVLSRFVFPGYDVIGLPLCLWGLPVMGAGWYIMRRASCLFNKKQTTFYLGSPAAFVQEDVYRFSRNPMYLGALILLLGFAILTGNLSAFGCPVFFFAGIHFLCIPPEETIMEKTFGSAYLTYQKQVRRWI